MNIYGMSYICNYTHTYVLCIYIWIIYKHIFITHISEYHTHTHTYMYIILKEIEDKVMKKKKTTTQTQGLIQL